MLTLHIMKRLILSIFVACLAIYANCQTITEPQAPDYRFSVVCDCSLPVNIMVANAKTWAITQLAREANNIYCDTTLNKIIVKSTAKLPVRHDYSNSTEEPILNFSLTMEFKEGRYRILIDDMSITEYTTSIMLGESRWSETYSAQQIFNFNKSPWQNRAKPKELRIAELEALDTTRMKKKEREKVETEIKELRKYVDSEYSSAENYAKLAEKHRIAVMDFLNQLAQIASTNICSEIEDW